MELIYSLATITLCSFLSEEHYKQRGTAGIGKHLKWFTTLLGSSGFLKMNWRFLKVNWMKIPTVGCLFQLQGDARSMTLVVLTNRITSDRERHRVTNDYVTPVRAKYKHLSSLNVWFMQTLALWNAVTKSGCCSVWEQRADSCSHRQQFRECHCPLGISAKFGCTETSLHPTAECVIDAY